MIQILDAQRDPTSVPSEEIISISVSGSSGAQVFGRIEKNGTTYPVSFTSVSLTEVKIREIPFELGSYSIILTQDGVDSNAFLYVVSEVKFPGTVPMPYGIRLNHSKNANYLIHSNDIKGGTHCYPDIYYLLFFPKEKMLYGMQAVVHFPDERISRTYVLDGTQDFDSIPYPLSNTDAGIEGSFRNYWKLLSESSYENEYLVDVQYAPDYKGGIPPYYENPDTLSRYIFPAGPEWDDERTFTENEWKDVRQQSHTWKRVRDQDSTEWSIPFLIDSASGSFVQENRFVRLFVQPDDDNQTDIKVPSFFGGEPNKFAYFHMWDTDYYFYDVPPAKYTSFAELDSAAQAEYEAIYGTVTDPTDETLLQRINTLWMTLASKDIDGNLKSGWTEPVQIIDGDGNLARYSVDGSGDINAVRQYIEDNAITDPGQIDFLYNEIGWEENYRFGAHTYGAFRDDPSEVWVVRKIANESGQFTKDFYKPYPISYYNQITNPRTKGNFTPSGKNAENNPEDPIQQFAWTDAPPSTVPEGFELWRAFTVLTNDESQQIGDYTLALVSGRIPVDVFAIKDFEYFETTVDDTTDGQEPVITRPFDWINVEAKAVYDGKDLHTLSYPTAGGTMQEELTYKWERIYNAGNPDSLIIFNNYPEEPPVPTPPAEFLITNNGRNLSVNHAGVDSSAVFQCTIYRKVDLLDEFEGTDLKWIPYVFEFSIWDQKDIIIRGVTVSPEAGGFIVNGNAPFPLQKTDFIGRTAINIKAFASNVDYTNGAWYLWNQAAGNFDDFRGNVAIESSTDPSYWIDLNDSDLNRGVLWNADNFNQQSTTNNTYKFQVPVDLEGSIVQVYDYATLFRNNTGANAKDIKISPESWAVPLDDAGTAFDGLTRKEFIVGSSNIPGATFDWSLRDKNGNEVATKSGASNFIFEADSTAAPGSPVPDYTPVDFADFTGKTPYTIRVTETTTNLWEEGIIATATGGDLGIKGDEGEGGVSVVYDSNDLVPTQTDGTPVGPVDEDTTVLMFVGQQASAGGLGAGEFTIRLVYQGSEVTSINDGGLIVDVVDNLTIQVTGIPINTNPKTIITFRIYENNSNPIIDSEGSVVDFQYKLVKSFQGANPLVMFLTNEAQIYNVDGAGNLISHEIDGIPNALAKSKALLSEGDTISDIPTVDDISFRLDGIDLARISQGNYYKFRLPSDNNNLEDTHVWLNKTTTEFYIVDQGLSLPPEQFVVDILWQGLDKAISMNRVTAPQDLKTVQLIPVNGNFAPVDRKDTFQFEFEVRYFIGNTQAQTPFGSLQVFIDGVEIPFVNVDSGRAIRFPATVFNGTAVLTVVSDGTYPAAYTIYDLYDNSKSINIYGGRNDIAPENFNALTDLPSFPPNQIRYHSDGSVWYIDYDSPLPAGGFKSYRVQNNTVTESTTPFVSFRGGTGSDRNYSYLFNGSADDAGPWMTTDPSAVTLFYNAVLFASQGKATGSTITLPNGVVIREFTFVQFYAVRGEAGEKGKDIRNVPIYFSGTDVRPATPTAQLLPTGWTMDPSTTGIIWQSSRSYEFVGKGNGDYPSNVATSSSHYKAYKAISGLNTWATPTRLSGYEGVTVARLYAKSSNTTSPTKPSDSVDMNGNTTWRPNVSDLGASPAEYVFEVKRNYNGDTPVTSWIGPYLWRAGQLTGIKGDKGDPGDIGPRPAHQWSGTSIRFQNPDGTWGAYVNLKGNQGDPGLIDGASRFTFMTSFTRINDQRIRAYIPGTINNTTALKLSFFGTVHVDYFRKNRQATLRVGAGTSGGVNTGTLNTNSGAITSLPDADIRNHYVAIAGVIEYDRNNRYFYVDTTNTDLALATSGHQVSLIFH